MSGPSGLASLQPLAVRVTNQISRSRFRSPAGVRLETKNSLEPSGDSAGVRSRNFPENGATSGMDHLPAISRLTQITSSEGPEVAGVEMVNHASFPSGLRAKPVSSSGVEMLPSPNSTGSRGSKAKIANHVRTVSEKNSFIVS